MRQAGRQPGRQDGGRACRQEGRRAGLQSMQADRQTEVKEDRCTNMHANRNKDVQTFSVHRHTQTNRQCKGKGKKTDVQKDYVPT